MDKSWSEKIADGVDRVIDWIIAILIILALLYSGYALWDSWSVINGARSTQNKLMAYKPDENLRASFEELLALNADVVAWITVDNTNIDYPVVQGVDNFEYLTKDVYGNYDSTGSIYLVTQNNPDFTDNYSILMGHHMQADAMFGNLDLFLDKAFFFENTTATLYLPDRVLWLESVALIEADAYDPMIFSVPTSDMDKFKNYIIDKATYYRVSNFKPDDQFIALATCASYETNGRTVMIYRVVKETSGVNPNEP